MINNPKNIIIWEGLSTKSMECMSWKEEDNEKIFTGHITGMSDDMPFGIHYMIETDADWRVQHFLISDLNDPDNALELYSDSKGKWFDRDQAVVQLEGCMDIDITLTPFTNTLPLRRDAACRHAPWPVNERMTIEVVYISVPEFTMEKAKQYYTKLSDNKFLFENDHGFKAELKLDKNLMVIDYPELFRRLYPV